MSISESIDFYYDGVLASSMGLINCHISSGLYEEPFLANKEIREVKVRGKENPYNMGVEREPLSFKLTFAFENPWDEAGIRAVARWLHQDTFKPFYTVENPDRIFYCQMVGSSELIHNGVNQGYVQLEFYCNSPFSYTKQISQTITPATPTFSRASIAYKQDGSQVLDEILRYEIGAYNQGIMIEEGTTNLFSSSESQGLASPTIKNLTAGTYTIAVNSGTGSIVLSNGASGTATLNNPVTFTLVSTTDVTFTPSGTISKCQLEQKAYPTSWQIGETARSVETLTVPTEGVFNKNNWVVEFVFEPKISPISLNRYNRIWRISIDNNNKYGLIISPSGRLYLSVTSSGVAYSTYNVNDPALEIGQKYKIGIRGNGSTITLFLNGTKSLVGDVAYMEPVGNLPNVMYLGCDSDLTNYGNGIYDDFCVSVSRTDEDMLTRGTRTSALISDEYTTYLTHFDGNLNVEDIVINNAGDLTIKPEIEITKIGDGDVTITNVTNGNQSFSFNNLSDNETVYVNCETEVILTDLSDTYRYSAFAGNFIELLCGENTLTVTGNATVIFRYQGKLLQD